MKKESISFNQWSGHSSPQKILVIRIQALGDLFFTFPLIADLKQKYPNSKIDLLTRSDYAPFAEKMSLFHQVHSIPINIKSRFQRFINIYASIKLALQLKKHQYEVVIDLQRNENSRLIRRYLNPLAWTEFDRFSPQSALVRNQQSINLLGLEYLEPNFSFAKTIPSQQKLMKLSEQFGKNSNTDIVIINPAGAFENRHWPLERYIEFINLWLKKHSQCQFVILGVDKIKQKADELQARYPEHVINLVNETSIFEAYQIVLSAKLMLTEDSGLGHFAWLSGVNTVMMLGATRHDWVAPIGQHTYCFHSGDLPCGDCWQFTCARHDNYCMTRLTSHQVFDKANALYSQK